jgi:hypothetical protein
MMAVLDLEVKNKKDEKMKKITIILCLLILVFTACNKKRTVHIKAINAVTGEPYAGLAYGISATTTGIGGEKKVYDHKGTLDANGEAFVTLRVRGNRTYNVGCTKPPNTCYVKDINFSFGKEDKNKNNFLFEYAECGYLRERIANINCQGSSDYMILYTSNQINSLDANGWEFFGCNGYYTEDYSTVPIGKYFHKWIVTKNGVTNTYYDTVSVGENEYITFDVNY